MCTRNKEGPKALTKNMRGRENQKHSPRPNENKKGTITGKQKGTVAVVLTQGVLNRHLP